MNSERWHRFKDVVARVMEWDRREWPARLIAECGDDVDLFFEASSLLALSPEASDFIEIPALQISRQADVAGLSLRTARGSR